MKTKLIGGAVLLAALTSVANAQETVSSADKKFVMAASQSGLAEVAESQIALKKSQRDDVKQFAQKMVDDHSKANDQLKQIASSDSVDVATAPSDTDQKMADKLQGLDGAKFDKQYISDQTTAHRKAVSLFEKESKSGKDDKLKQFASDTLPTLEDHYKMVKSLPKTAKSM